MWGGYIILTQLSKIGDVSSRYGISSRTLRYYEEIGLILSIRESSNSKRFYSPEMLRRLELVLLLKKLQFSVKDITKILLSDDMLDTLQVFSEKLKIVKTNICDMILLKELLERFMELLQSKGNSKEDVIKLILDNSNTINLDVSIIIDSEGMNNNMEELSDMNNNPAKLEDHEVRFIELKPMKVAYYHSTVNQPEDEAWNVLYAWVKEKGLDQISTTRYFGFDKQGDNQEHGYEMWALVPDDVEPSGDIGIKQVDGGLFAVSSLYGHDIPVAWGRLSEWIQNSKYKPGQQQCIEEHFLFDGDMYVNEAFQLDLYSPISTKD